MASKSTLAEVAQRVEKVTELLLQGWPRQKICEYTRENWEISDSQVDRYLADARILIKEQSQGNTAEKFAMAEARYEYLYGEALLQGNVSLAVRVLKDLSVLQGLNGYSATTAPEIENLGAFYQVMNTYGIAIKNTVTPEQVREIVNKATALGASVNICNMAESGHVDSSTEDMMTLAVQDYKLLHRTRTREELVRDEWLPIDQVASNYEGLKLPIIQE
jgi:hypothetical protein